MKKISASAMCFTFTGCFLGAGYVSGQELYQFFGAFGAAGIVGLFIAVALLGVFNVMLVSIVKSTGDTRIDRGRSRFGKQNSAVSCRNGGNVYIFRNVCRNGGRRRSAYRNAYRL